MWASIWEVGCLYLSLKSDWTGQELEETSHPRISVAAEALIARTFLLIVELIEF